MKILAIILLSFFAFQEKSVPQETKKAVASTEQKEVKAEEKSAAPTPSPVIIPRDIPQGVSIKTADGETKTLTQEEIKKLLENSQTSTGTSGLVFENGAFYIKTGNFSVPLSGGGASGCIGNSQSKMPEVLQDAESKVKDEKENSDKPKQP